MQYEIIPDLIEEVSVSLNNCGILVLQVPLSKEMNFMGNGITYYTARGAKFRFYR